MTIRVAAARSGFAALHMLNSSSVLPKLGLSSLNWPVRSDVLALDGRSQDLAYSTLRVQRSPRWLQCLRQALSKSSPASFRGIDPNVASKPRVGGGLDGGTIYLTTADRWGNMVSLIHSVFSVYGSRATVGRFGFVLHNRGSAFSLDPRSPNVVAPRKRPFHSIIAGFVMKDGRPLMTFGNMGGNVQPETHAQHIVNLIDLGMNVQMRQMRRGLAQPTRIAVLEQYVRARWRACARRGTTCVVMVGGRRLSGICLQRSTLPEPSFDRDPRRCAGSRVTAPVPTHPASDQVSRGGERSRFSAGPHFAMTNKRLRGRVIVRVSALAAPRTS